MVESALAMMEFLRPLFIVTAVALVVIVVVVTLIIAPRFLALSLGRRVVSRDPSEIRFTFCAGVLTFGIYLVINLFIMMYMPDDFKYKLSSLVRV